MKVMIEKTVLKYKDNKINLPSKFNTSKSHFERVFYLYQGG